MWCGDRHVGVSWVARPLRGRDADRGLGRGDPGQDRFGWTLGGQGEPVTFFLDDIRYE